MRLIASLLIILCCFVPMRAAMAMQFSEISAGGRGLIYASGKIVLGDEARLRAALAATPAGIRLAGLSLNSPGGDLEEGFRLAAAIREQRLPVVIGDKAMCASACFSVFAAAPHRSASSTALIGVHGASFGGHDEVFAQAMTVQAARQLASDGVPEAILGKMITTRPDQIWWLTRADLETMQVDVNVPRFDAGAAAIGPAASVPPALQVAIPAAAAKPGAAKPGAAKPGAAKPGAAKPGFHLEPSARGYQVVPPPAGGFRVCHPGLVE